MTDITAPARAAASTRQQALATTFHDLHRGPQPLRFVNAWDAVSARVFAGAPAIATSSFAVALSHGYNDGQHAPWSLVCDTVAAVAAAVDVPVTADIETGRDDVEQSVADILAAGAIGINLEDAQPGRPGALFAAGEQCERIAAARRAADAAGIALFINARCDVYFGAAIPPHEQLPAALARTAAYVTAGADGVFLPGCLDLEAFRLVAGTARVPVNAMLWPGLPPVDELAEVGVRRISQGGAAFLAAAGALERITHAYLTGEPEAFGGDIQPAYHLIAGLVYR